MKDNIDFIVFAIKQARDAEGYGFSRNICCRNLKIAIHYYWQNKTLGLSGVSQKKNIPRSKLAMNKELRECDVEHVVPTMVIVNMLMDMKPLTKRKVEKRLKKYLHVLVVTKEEHRKLNSSGLRYKMPEDWDGENVWARYEKVGIERATG